MSKVIVILLVLLCSGCTAALYHVSVTDDKFDNYQRYRMEWNTLSKVKGEFMSGNIQLNVQKIKSKNGDSRYSLILDYASSDWLFIGDGESMIMLIDGKRVAFSGDGSSKFRRVITGEVLETAFYDIALEKLMKIANAQDVQVKIIGSQYSIKRQFSKKNFENFKRFLNEYAEQK